MSRTFRRINYDKTLLRNLGGSKQFGIYAVRDVFNDQYFYRSPTNEELIREFLFRYGESKSSNSRTPNRLYRKNRERRLRTYHKRVIRDALNQPDFEMGVVYNTPASHLWDWS